MPANATTPDELPSQPRKASWKRWTLAFACVLVIALVVLLMKAPTPEPISVRFLGSTNDNVTRKLLFEGTNGCSKPISYFACVAPAAQKRAILGGFVGEVSDIAVGMPLRKETFNFSLNAPTKGTNWLVVWCSFDPDEEKRPLVKARRACCLFLLDHHMSAVAQVLNNGTRIHMIPASDLKD